MTDLPNFPSGTLSDGQLREAQRIGWLISENFHDPSIHQACYELRAGNVYYELDRTNNDTNPKQHELRPGDYILLKPKQLITVITHESLKLPSDVLGRVLTKGQLFSIGVMPVNTYADPGFEGRLGIVLANFSNNYLKIQQLDPIAKIEFSKLAQPVTNPYSGQHGYQTRMWPIPYAMILSKEQLKTDPRVLTPSEEILCSHGEQIATIVDRVVRFERRLLLAGVFYFIATSALLALMVGKGEDAALSTWTAVLLGVVSNSIFGALTYFATSLKR